MTAWPPASIIVQYLSKDTNRPPAMIKNQEDKMGTIQFAEIRNGDRRLFFSQAISVQDHAARSSYRVNEDVECRFKLCIGL